jgi:hypothetical protein
MICGVEGLWSFLMCLVCQIIAQYMPGEEGNGIREDSLDTLAMVHNDPSLWGVIAASWFLGITYNCVSTTLIGRTSAVIRTLMEAFRTFLIWMVQFGIFYLLNKFGNNPRVWKFRLAGEEWSIGAWVQLGGFLLMTWSLFLYNRIPKYPCFNYGPIHFKAAPVPETPEAPNGVAAARRRPDDGADKSLHIVSEIETNVDNSVTPALDSADEPGNEDDSVRSMSVDDEAAEEDRRDPGA